MANHVNDHLDGTCGADEGCGGSEKKIKKFTWSIVLGSALVKYASAVVAASVSSVRARGSAVAASL